MSGGPGEPGEEENFMYSNDEASIANKDANFTIINTNARSLCPKINSLVDCFEEVLSLIHI